MDVRCNLEEQRHSSYWKQARKENRDELYIAYSGSTHCCLIYIIKDTETIPASAPGAEGKSSCQYQLINVPSAEYGLGLNSPTTPYVKKINLFDKELIPVDIFEHFMQRLRREVLEMWTSGQSCLPDIVDLFDRPRSEMLTVKVDKEIQYNSWLFQQVTEILCPQQCWGRYF